MKNNIPKHRTQGAVYEWGFIGDAIISFQKPLVFGMALMVFAKALV